MLARVALASVSALAVLALAGAPADAAVKVKLEPVVTGVNTPLAMVQPKGDDRKFVIEQWGRVRIIDAEGNLLAEPFLDIRNRIVDLWADFDERGLLGLAFHPDFATNGKFYVAYSTPHQLPGRSREEVLVGSHQRRRGVHGLRRTTRTRPTRTPRRIISSIDWPQFNHNGHWIGFGAGRQALHLDRRRRLRQRLGHRPQRDRGQRSGPDHARTARSCASTRTGRCRGQSVRQQPRCDAADLGLRPSQPVALLVRHGRRERALLRRRAAEQLRGGRHRRQGPEQRLAQDGGRPLLRLREARQPSGRAATKPG